MLVQGGFALEIVQVLILALGCQGQDMTYVALCGFPDQQECEEQNEVVMKAE